jgi:hypothetical protein
MAFMPSAPAPAAQEAQRGSPIRVPQKLIAIVQQRPDRGPSIAVKLWQNGINLLLHRIRSGRLFRHDYRHGYVVKNENIMRISVR